jgi:hypothetical protein
LILNPSANGAAIAVYARDPGGIVVRQANRQIRLTDDEARTLALALADHLTGEVPLGGERDSGPKLTRYFKGQAEQVHVPGRRRVYTTESAR